VQSLADKIVMPHHNAAQQMERMISRPTTADLLESLSEATNASIELEDLPISASSHLVNRTLDDCHAAEDFHWIIVGLRRETGQWEFNPPTTTRLSAGDCLIVIGSREDIARFRGRG
jgi:voltage-gated potassium channel